MACGTTTTILLWWQRCQVYKARQHQTVIGKYINTISIFVTEFGWAMNSKKKALYMYMVNRIIIANVRLHLVHNFIKRRVWFDIDRVWFDIDRGRPEGSIQCKSRIITTPGTLKILHPKLFLHLIGLLFPGIYVEVGISQSQLWCNVLPYEWVPLYLRWENRLHLSCLKWRGGFRGQGHALHAAQPEPTETSTANQIKVWRKNSQSN